MYSFCNNKIDKENVSVWASLYIQKETKYVRVGFGFGWVFFSHKHSWRKIKPADIAVVIISFDTCNISC